MIGLSGICGSLVQRLASGSVAPAVACSAVSGVRHVTELALDNIRAGVVGGPGNRASVSGGVATVFGATGFVGHYVVSALARHGTQVVCPFRSVEEKAIPLKQMGDLGQIVLLKDWHLNNDEMTKYAINRSNIVINLVGNALETRNFSYEDVHSSWPARLAQFVAESPEVERFIHFSDMGAAADHPSRRLRSKAAGAEAVRQTFPNATIFKPSPILGDEDDFMNNLLFQLKYSASLWMIDGFYHRFQPLPRLSMQPSLSGRCQPSHVTDVARAVAATLHSHDAKGKDYYLAGPETLALRDLVKIIQECLHVTEDNTVYVPAAVAKLAYAPGDLLRRKLPPMPGRNYMFTSDFVDEISRDKLAPAGSLGYQDLGILPMKVTEGLPIEAIRYQRTGGYSLGDTKALAKSLPASVKRYFGMEVPH